MQMNFFLIFSANVCTFFVKILLSLHTPHTFSNDVSFHHTYHTQTLLHIRKMCTCIVYALNIECSSCCQILCYSLKHISIKKGIESKLLRIHKTAIPFPPKRVSFAINVMVYWLLTAVFSSGSYNKPLQTELVCTS